ncbi:MAG: lytic transglycosylase domain-containing protein [bacterium]|nr:lytic transglycosylase domain-containing protein [bacterium]
MLSWPKPSYVDALKGARLLADGAPVRVPALAIARAVLRTNARITAIGALSLAEATVRAARHESLPPEFLAATLLQESAYDPYAFSSAGALGIAQFEPETAREHGVDPYDPLDAIRGAAALLADYLRAYRDRYADPYAAALAAYNAGPGAVAYYGGVPPYAQTREYVELIYERWARIGSYEGSGNRSPALKRKE